MGLRAVISSSGRVILIGVLVALGPGRPCPGGAPPALASHAAAVAPAGPVETEINFRSLSGLLARDKAPCTLPPMATWQEEDKCGLNCAYLLLHLSGYPTEYETLAKQAGAVPPGGFSLEQLREICARAGLDCRVVFGTPARLTALDPPAIVHIGDPDRPGHFLCYFARDPDAGKYQFVDGTTGLLLRVGGKAGHSPNVIAREASGYLLIPHESSLPWALRTATAVVWGLAVLVWTGVAIARILALWQPSRRVA